MNRVIRSLQRIAGAAAAFVLAGCTGAQIAPQPNANPRFPAVSVLTGAAALRNGPASAGLGRSWLDPQTRKQGLIYVSDFNNSIVEVYTYPKGKHVGVISGVLNPQGQCTDDAGNVYIADTGDGNVLEYAHGGTTPIRVLDDPGEYPVGCSVNPGNGDVAASDFYSPTTGQGAVTVWKPGENQGTTYVEPDGILECFFIAYDGSGNLYVNGVDSSGPALAYLRAGSNTWETATVKGLQFDWPGNMQWDGRYLAFAASVSEANAVYRVRFHGRFGRVAKTVQFAGSIDDLDIFGPQGQRKLATMSVASPQVAVYRYPAGGSAVKTIALPDTHSYPSYNGMAISRKP